MTIGPIRRFHTPEGVVLLPPIICEDTPMEEHFADLGGGFSLVNLCRIEALNEESRVLRHSLFYHGGYLEFGERTYLSIRDRLGARRATVEIDNWNKGLRQILGQDGARPPVEAMRAVVPFLKGNGYQAGGWNGRPELWGFIVDSAGDWHELERLPANLLIDDRVLLWRTSVKAFPRGMKVNGSFQVFDSPDFRVPDDLQARDGIFVDGRRIDRGWLHRARALFRRILQKRDMPKFAV